MQQPLKLELRPRLADDAADRTKYFTISLGRLHVRPRVTPRILYSKCHLLLLAARGIHKRHQGKPEVSEEAQHH